MAKPLDFAGANVELGAPPGHEHNVGSLKVFRNGQCCVSCWQFSPDELRKITENGGRFYVSVFAGASQPPIFVGDEDQIRAVVADIGGVWKRSENDRSVEIISMLMQLTFGEHVDLKLDGDERAALGEWRKNANEYATYEEIQINTPGFWRYQRVT